MKKLFLILVILLPSCKRPDRGPGQEFTFKTEGKIEGVTSSDHDCIFDVSFIESTQFQITAGNVALNHYEFTVSKNQVCFAHLVTLLPGGRYTYPVPFEPAVVAGTPFVIEFQN